VLVLTVYVVFAITLYLLPPRLPGEGTVPQKTTERSIQRAYDDGKFTPPSVTAPERSACCAKFS
jgi:Ca2+:H+ antiporter